MALGAFHFRSVARPRTVAGSRPRNRPFPPTLLMLFFRGLLTPLLASCLINCLVAAGQDCGPPPHVARSIQTVQNESVGNQTIATVLYKCLSGTKLASPGYISASCNHSAMWDLDELSAPWKDCNVSPLSEGCKAMDASNLTEVNVTLLETPHENFAVCIAACRVGKYPYMARQGPRCYCFQSLTDLNPPDMSRLDCDGYCHDNLSFCGSQTGLYSVYKTIHDRVSIEERNDLYVPVNPMYTKVNCVEYCKARPSLLAFYITVEQNCYCLDEIPTYTAVFTTKQETNDTGTLDITHESEMVAFSCQQLFTKGIFYHGNYILSNDREVTCYFYDNSSQCDVGWVAYDNGCYRFADEMANASWHYQMCKESDSLLASIGDDLEMTFVTTAMRATGSYIKDTPGYLLGLVDTTNLFSYMWADESLLSYRPFKKGFPNNISNECILVETNLPTIINVNCVAFIATAICEKRSSTPGCATPVVPLLSPIATSDTMVTALCFETCRSHGHSLSITNGSNCHCDNDINNFQLVRWDNCDLPCSIHPFQMCGGSQGTVFITQEQGQPYRETCDLMILEGMVTNVTLQNDTHVSIVDCQERAGEVCPLTWLDVEGGCYRFFPEYNDNATLTCISMGGYLSVFESAEEKTNVIDTLRSIDAFVGDNETWALGLYYHRAYSSRARHTNGAWVQPSLQAYAVTAEDLCSVIRFPSGDQVQEGGSCVRNPFICEKSSVYMGCYNVTGTNQSSTIISGYPEMTVRLCIEACKPTGKPFAGLFGTQTCLCVDTLGESYDIRCTDLCASMQSCGSYTDQYMSVYSIDYTVNASSCADLFDQGVLLNWNYTLGDGAEPTWCGMKNSTFLADYAKERAAEGVGGFTNHRFGEGDHVLSLDIWPTLNASMPGLLLCKDIYEPSSIVAPTTNPVVQSLITQVLQWSLDVYRSVPAVIGAVDLFGMGSYTWSNGDLFRPWDYNTTDDVIYRYNETRSGYLMMDYKGMLDVRDVEEVNHVACVRDTTYVGCYRALNWTDVTSRAPVRDYQSVSVTLCRQVCRAVQATHFLISTRSCLCHTPSNSATLMTDDLEQVNSTEEACFQECPAHPYQFCGDPPYFRYHKMAAVDVGGEEKEMEEATSCTELYDNLVVYNTTYTINGTTRYCGLDDSTESCPPGFISKDHRCYAFQRREDISADGAATQCFLRASFLASPTTNNETQTMTDLIQSFTQLRGAQLWLLGYYATFQPGYWTSSLGYMMHFNHSLASELEKDDFRKCVALNASSNSLVSVSCDEKLPFICESNSPYLGCAYVDPENVTSSLDLSEVMTLQQCISFCRGHVEDFSVVAIRQTSCSCLTSADKLPSLTRDGCTTQTRCPSQSNQMCGDGPDDPENPPTSLPLHSVYDVTAMPEEFLVHTCDDLFSFGVFLPALYRTKNGSDVLDDDSSVEWVRCFQYSSKSNYILLYDPDVVITTSASDTDYQAADVTLKVYEFKGWQGQTVTTDEPFIQVSLPEYYVLEGMILVDPSSSWAGQTLELTVSLDQDYYTKLETITLQPSRTLTWHYLPVPMVLRHFRLSFNKTDRPRLSMEMIGYKYNQHNFHDSYLGCHLMQDMTSSVLSFTSPDFRSCREDCQGKGYSHLSISYPDTCQCRAITNLRDMYPIGHCNETCWGTTCDSHTDDVNTKAVYSTTDLICPPIHLNHSLTKETVVMPGYMDDVTVATSLEITCVAGYEYNEMTSFMTSMTSLNTTCHNEMTWHPNIIGFHCVRIECEPPPSHSEASIIDTNGTRYNDVAVYSCGSNPGVIFDGINDTWTVVCGPDKEWISADIPACSRRVCPPPPTVTLATSNTSGDVTHLFGDSVLYVCEDGARFSVSNTTELTSTCTDTGQWSLVETTCTRFQCPSSLPPVPNSMYSQNETTGLYTCIYDHTFSDRSSTLQTNCNNDTGLVWTRVPSNCTRSTSRDSPWVLYSTAYRLTTDPVSIHTSRSVTGCAISCLTDSRCLKFSHNDSTGSLGNCVVSLNREANVTFSRDGEEADGWSTFYMGGPS